MVGMIDGGEKGESKLEWLVVGARGKGPGRKGERGREPWLFKVC